MNDQDYKNTLFELKYRQGSRQRVQFLLRIYSWFGLVLSLIAGGYFLLSFLEFSLSTEQVISLIAFGVGIALSLMAGALMAFLKERDAEKNSRSEEIMRLADFLDAWQSFERVSKNAIVEGNGDFNVHSVREIISYLQEEKMVDEEDVTMLEEGLRARNLIVHGKRNFLGRTTERMTDSLIEITRKLSRST